MVTLSTHKESLNSDVNHSTHKESLNGDGQPFHP